MEKLFDMLRYKRRHKTNSERRFTAKFLDTVPGMQHDAFGNRYIAIGEPNGVLFSSHIDSVHPRSGMQTIMVDPERQEVFKNDKNPLGADDAAGMWLMLKMIENGVEGMYIFHRGEERGGLGSSWILKNRPDLLEGITRAIAFDRKGIDSVITHQSYGRCCSDEFANDLCYELGKQGVPHVKDDTGSFTDTATYMDTIPECTNVSCGYYNEHTTSEVLDYAHLMRLGEAVCKIDWAGLAVKRDPTAYDPDDYGWGSMARYDGGYATPSANTYTPAKSMHSASYEQLYEYCYYHPELAAQLLQDLGAGADDIRLSSEDVDRILDEQGYKG